MRMLEQTVSGLGDPVSLVELRALGGEAVVMARWQHGDKRLEFPSADALRVVLSLGGAHRVRHKANGQAPLCTPGIPGFIGLLPPGEASETFVEGEADVVKFFIDAVSPGHPDGGWPSLPPLVAADEAVRSAAVATFVAASAGDEPRSRRAATTLRGAAHRLLLSQALRRTYPYKGGLRSAARRRVECLIEQRLDAPQRGLPSVGALAAEAGLSVNHFIRAFRQVTGETPHQHVMARRQQRALALLGQPGPSVGEVADLLGFSSPAHFVASFRGRFGATPGEFRDAVLDPRT